MVLSAATIIETIVSVSAGIARHDPTGRLVGITAGAFFEHHPEVITGYRPLTRPCILAYLPQITSGVGIGSLDSFDQRQNMTDGILLPQSYLAVASMLDDVVRRQGFLLDCGCSSGGLLAYLTHYFRCEGTGFEIVSDRAVMARRIADKVRMEYSSHPLVTIFECDFMNPPASANFELTMIAILNVMKFDHSLILALMDKLITECARLSHVVKVVPLSREHAAHFAPPTFCRYSARGPPIP